MLAMFSIVLGGDGGHLSQAIVIEPAHRQVPQMLRDLNPLGAGAVACTGLGMVAFMLMAMVTTREAVMMPRLVQSVAMVTFFLRNA